MTDASHYLSDLDLLGGPEPDPATATAALALESPEKADMVLSAFTAAGCRFPFGTDMTDAKQLWSQKLAGYDFEVLTGAIEQWIAGDTHDAPSLGEFTAVANQLQREANRQRAIEAGRAHGLPGQVCAECRGERWIDYTVEVLHSTECRESTGVADYVCTCPRYDTVKPCSQCLPHEHKLWTGGHRSKDHQDAGGCRECRPKR